MSQAKSSFWNTPLTRTNVKTDEVRTPEMLFGYFIGPFGALLSSGIFTSILQNYFTDVLKLDLAFLTSLQLISTIFIVIANLIVGQLIERTHTIAGKARPWILLSALTLSVASVLMFIVPFEGTAKMVWIAIAYNLYYAVAYPIYNTANSTLVPVSTRDSQKRSMLASFTNIAGMAVMGAGSMVFPILVSFSLKESVGKWFAAMLAVAIFAGLTIYLQFRNTRERVTEETEGGSAGQQDEPKKAAPIKEQLKAVTSEKTWWIAIFVYMLYMWSGQMKNSSMAYYCKWVLDNSFFGSADAWGASQSLLAIIGAVPMALAAVAVVPLAQKFSKRWVVFGGFLIGILGGFVAGAGNAHVVPTAVGVALKCLGCSPIAYLVLAILADVIDHIEYKTGMRTDGLTMSIYSSIMVAGTPIMNAVFSVFLRMTGYVQEADVSLGRAAQNTNAQFAIGFGYIWVEVVCYVIAAVLIFFFAIEKDLPQEQKEIAARKNH